MIQSPAHPTHFQPVYLIGPSVFYDIANTAAVVADPVANETIKLGAYSGGPISLGSHSGGSIHLGARPS